MKTLKITTDSKISIIDLNFDHESLREEVGGYVELVRTQKLLDYFKTKVVMIVDEEGLVKNLLVNPMGCYFYDTEKRYDRDGCIASYSSDRKLSAADLLTGQYLEKELGKKVETLIASAKREVEECSMAGACLVKTTAIFSMRFKLMKGLASGIANSIPIVAAKAPIIIGKLASTIITNLPKILTAGVQIVSKLAVGLVRGIPALIGKIPSMVSQIRNAFTSVNWGSVGMNIVKGIASGLANAGGVIVKAAKSAAKSALDAAKSALGIHSPSRVFRDQVGKMMALGMGIGFEKNIPLKSMNVGVQRAVSGLQKSVDLALSARTVDKTVGRVKSYPGFDGGKDIDYDRLERIQMKAADKLSKRPIYLGTKRIDEPLPKGAVPVW